MTWTLVFYRINKEGRNISQTWINDSGRQFALSGITLGDYCRARQNDVYAKEILAQAEKMGIMV